MYVCLFLRETEREEIEHRWGGSVGGMGKWTGEVKLRGGTGFESGGRMGNTQAVHKN